MSSIASSAENPLYEQTENLNKAENKTFSGFGVTGMGLLTTIMGVALPIIAFCTHFPLGGALVPIGVVIGILGLVLTGKGAKDFNKACEEQEKAEKEWLKDAVKLLTPGNFEKLKKSVSELKLLEHPLSPHTKKWNLLEKLKKQVEEKEYVNQISDLQNNLKREKIRFISREQR